MSEVLRWFVQSLIALDCLCNSFVLPIFTLSVGMSGESMSAHTYRDAVKGRWWAVRIMPLIDWLFSWQTPDPRFVDEHGQVITAHCHRAFEKLRSGFYLPPEYITQAKETQA